MIDDLFIAWQKLSTASNIISNKMLNEEDDDIRKILERCLYEISEVQEKINPLI